MGLWLLCLGLTLFFTAVGRFALRRLLEQERRLQQEKEGWENSPRRIELLELLRADEERDAA